MKRRKHDYKIVFWVMVAIDAFWLTSLVQSISIGHTPSIIMDVVMIGMISTIAYATYDKSKKNNGK